MLAGTPEIEPNDSIDPVNQATQLILIGDPSGSGMRTAYGEGQIDPATSSTYWSDPDYCEFDALVGDVVSIAVATPGSSVDPYVELRNSADGIVDNQYNHDGGADTDAFISHYTIPVSGNYFALVGKGWSSTVTGAYQLRVDIARGINHESDTDYANDTIGTANLLDLDQDVTAEQVVGKISGTIMATQISPANTDEDYYSLGILDPTDGVNPASVIELDIALPSIASGSGSEFDPSVRVVDSSGTDLADSTAAGDGNLVGAVLTSDEYFAVVEANANPGPLAQYLMDIDIADQVPPEVASLEGLPEEGETSSDVISSLSVTFSERMYPDTVLAADAFELHEAGPNGILGDSDDVEVALVAETAFGEFSRTVEFYLQAGPLSSGDYQFTVTDIVTDRAGNELDGNADGIEGDPYVRSFTLDLPADFVLEGPDNDEISGATALPLTEDPTGLLLGFGLGSIDPSGDGDGWSFEGEAGDRVGIAGDTPNSGLRTWVGLYNSSGTRLTADASSGPDNDGYISDYTLPSDPTDTYYV